jgi:hypothetical protein
LAALRYSEAARHLLNEIGGRTQRIPRTLAPSRSAHDTRRLAILRFDRLVYRPLGGGGLGIVRADLNHEPADAAHGTSLAPINVHRDDQARPVYRRCAGCEIEPLFSPLDR